MDPAAKLARCEPRSSPTCTSAAPAARTSCATPTIRRVAAGGDRRRRPRRPARRRRRAARAAARRSRWRHARPFFEELGAALATARSSSSPATTTTASPSRCSTQLSSPSRPPLGLEHRTTPPPARPPRSTAWLGAGRAAHRLPRHLAARRRLRHPRPLHGLPPDPAASRVRGAAAVMRVCRPAARPRDAGRLRARPAPRLRASPSASPSRAPPGWRAAPATPPRLPGSWSPEAQMAVAGGGDDWQMARY